MVNYGWECKNWTNEEKQTFAGALSVKLGIPMFDVRENDGKSPYLEIDHNYEGVRIRRLTWLPEEKKDEIVKEANLIYDASLQQFKITAGGIRGCVLCGVILQDMGNNPEPLSDEGRCCDECKNKKVIPARIHSMGEEKENQILNANLVARGASPFTKMKKIGRINLEKDKILNTIIPVIPVNDRLVEYQILKQNMNSRFTQNQLGAEDFIEQSKMSLVRGMWKSAYEPSFNNAKVWNIDEEQVPVIFHSDSPFDEHLPFPSLIINATIPIKNRIYYGIFVGSFYTEDYRYRLLFSTYSEEYIAKAGEDGKILWGMEIFPLDEVAYEDFSVTKLSFYQKKLRNFMFSFLNYINEPEVEQIDMPFNPQNNKRRAERGRMPLPAYKRVVVKGKLRVYIDKVYDRIKTIRNNSLREYWVRGMYHHFRNKQRFRRLYAMTGDQLSRAGYSEYNQIIRLWKRPQVRNRGAEKVAQEWDVK